MKHTLYTRFDCLTMVRSVFFFVLAFFLCGLQSLLFGVLPLEGPVNDYANVLNSRQKANLSAFLLSMERDTGYQVVVLTVPSLEGSTIEKFAFDFYNYHGIGKKKEDLGVLFIIATKDRKVRIEVGYGAEERLTDAICSMIISNTTVPLLKKGKYFEAIKATVDKINEAIRSGLVEKKVDEDDDWGGALFVCLLVYAFLIFLGISVLESDRELAVARRVFSYVLGYAGFMALALFLWFIYVPLADSLMTFVVYFTLVGLTVVGLFWPYLAYILGLGIITMLLLFFYGGSNGNGGGCWGGSYRSSGGSWSQGGGGYSGRGGASGGGGASGDF